MNTPASDIALELTGVSKRFGRRCVLDGLALTVKRGEIVGLLGPNGSGKTTTLRIAAGVLWADGGQVRIAGRTIDPAATELRARIGYLPERVPLYDAFTVDEYLAFVAAARGLGGSARSAAVQRVLNAFDLDRVRRRVIGQLSKGFRQRIGLAAALVGEPDVLLLDEPTNGLDPFQIIEARTMIRSAAEQRGVVISTHILQEVAALCTRVVFLKNGRLIDIASSSVDGCESIVAVLRAADATALRAAILALDPRIVIDAMIPSEGALKITVTLPVDPRLRGALAELLVGQGDLYEFGGAESALEAVLATALADHRP